MSTSLTQSTQKTSQEILQDPTYSILIYAGIIIASCIVLAVAMWMISKYLKNRKISRQQNTVTKVNESQSDTQESEIIQSQNMHSQVALNKNSQQIIPLNQSAQQQSMSNQPTTQSLKQCYQSAPTNNSKKQLPVYGTIIDEAEFVNINTNQIPSVPNHMNFQSNQNHSPYATMQINTLQQIESGLNMLGQRKIDPKLVSQKSLTEQQYKSQTLTQNQYARTITLPSPRERVSSLEQSRQNFTSTHSLKKQGSQYQSDNLENDYVPDIMPARITKPFDIDLSDLPKSDNDIKKKLSQVLRVQLDMNYQNDRSSFNVPSSRLPFTSNNSRNIEPGQNNIYQSQITFTEIEQTYVNPNEPLSIPAFRQLVQDLDFKLKKIIAKGGTSTIFEVDILNQSIISSNYAPWGFVAKVIKENEVMQQEDIFNQEIAIMQDLSSHQNFVKLVGFSISPKVIIMPYYQYGNLKDLILDSNPRLNIPNEQWNMILVKAILIDISSALAFMHSKNFSHNDVKPENVLLDITPNNVLICMLTDFSISTITSDERMGVKAMKRSDLVGLSITYAAPEYVKEFFEFRKRLKKDPNAEMKHIQSPVHSRDSYSFGIVCYEVMLRVKSYQEMSRDQIRKAVLNGHRPVISEELIRLRMSDRNWGILINICESCWSSDMYFRLTMNDIIKRLLLINTQQINT